MSPPNAHRYEHLVAYALEHPWAVTPNMRTLIADLLAKRLAGEDADVEALARAKAQRETRTVTGSPEGSGVAVIPIAGLIAPRMNLFSDVSGGATFEGLTQQLQAAVADPAVKTIVFDVDSPGGNVAGSTEFARAVLNARASKTIIAHANHLMASAAYWTMAGATEIVASPSALVGSIGVYALYDDLTAAMQSHGVKREVFSAGKYKADGVGGTALTDEARAHIQALIDGAYGRFVGDVAKGRGVSTAAVRNGFGEGRVLDAETAKTEGLVDRVATLDETLARVTRSTSRRLSAEAPPPATSQEPSPATDQELAAVSHDAAGVEYERRLFALRLHRLKAAS
jgi:signal peptide peptidase SppA